MAAMNKVSGRDDDYGPMHKFSGRDNSSRPMHKFSGRDNSSRPMHVGGITFDGALNPSRP
jgi:hypothetical protein